MHLMSSKTINTHPCEAMLKPSTYLVSTGGTLSVCVDLQPRALNSEPLLQALGDRRPNHVRQLREPVAGDGIGSVAGGCLLPGLLSRVRVLYLRRNVPQRAVCCLICSDIPACQRNTTASCVQGDALGQRNCKDNARTEHFGPQVGNADVMTAEQENWRRQVSSPSRRTVMPGHRVGRARSRAALALQPVTSSQRRSGASCSAVSRPCSVSRTQSDASSTLQSASVSRRRARSSTRSYSRR